VGIAERSRLLKTLALLIARSASIFECISVNVVKRSSAGRLAHCLCASVKVLISVSLSEVKCDMHKTDYTYFLLFAKLS
jgi:hypothetical protein